MNQIFIPPNTEFYEIMKKVKPGVRLLGIISMDEHKPKRFYARVFVLDEWYFKRNAMMFPKDKIIQYTNELKKVTSWMDLVQTKYFDAAIIDIYYYANNPELGSSTMEDALSKLKLTMKEIANEMR